YKPRSLITITVQCCGTQSVSFSSSFIQWGCQAPFCSAPTTVQSPGMAHPRYTTLMHSTVKRFASVVASCVQRQSWLIRGPPRQDPLQQRSKTRTHVQFTPLLAFFVLGTITPFAQALQQALL